MSFFNIFKGKPKRPQKVDKVYMNQSEKDKAVSNMAKNGSSPTFLVWSIISFQYYQNIVGESILLIDDKMIHSRVTENDLVFLEHHFSKEKEMEFIKLLKLDKAIFMTSIDDPLFVLFDSGRIKDVMIKMGHNENEALEHDMISKSIARAQGKLLEEGLPDNCDVRVREWYDSINN